MSYVGLGVPLENCQDDFDCDLNELCCEHYCRTGADITEYCTETDDGGGAGGSIQVVKPATKTLGTTRASVGPGFIAAAGILAVLTAVYFGSKA